MSGATAIEPWRATARTAVVGAAAFPIAAAQGDGSPSRAQAAADRTIVEIAAGDRRFDTLVELVTSAGLAETLSSGEFTIFAPTDQAFPKVPKKTLKALANDKEALKSVLLYHAVKGSVPAKKVVKLTSVKTVNGANVKIRVTGKNVFLTKTRKVIQTDIKASNGVIHVINGVLLPPK